DGEALTLLGQVSWEKTEESYRGGILPRIWMPIPYYYASLELVQLESGRVIASEGTALREILYTDGKLDESRLELTGTCAPQDNKAGYRLRVLNGSLYVTYQETFEHPDKSVRNIELAKNYIAPAVAT